MLGVAVVLLVVGEVFPMAHAALFIRHDPIVLTLQAPDHFSGSTWFFGSTEFERNATGAITGMLVSAGRVRDVLFVKRVGAIVGR